MGRYKGTFVAAANYEPLIGGPFDARELVETQNDLINPATWRQANGDIWTYVGMKVSVSSDDDKEKNGLYILINKDFSSLSNWQKLASQLELEKLEEKIDKIETNGGVDLDSINLIYGGNANGID